jgi:hypothetical protein
MALSSLGCDQCTIGRKALFVSGSSIEGRTWDAIVALVIRASRDYASDTAPTPNITRGLDQLDKQFKCSNKN